MLQLMNQLGMMLRQHTHEIAMMILATLLVIYGDGYLLIGFTPILASWIYTIPLHLLGPAVLGLLLVLGVLAERKKQL